MSTDVLKPRQAGLILALILCLFGAVFSNVGGAWALLAVSCIAFLLFAYLFDAVCFVVIAVALAFPCSANFIVVAHYDEDVRAGYSFMVVGIWLAFVCMSPEDLGYQLRQWNGLYRILCAVALFFDLLGTWLLWGSISRGGPVALANGVLALLSGVLFVLASTYQTEVWVWVSLFWSSYFQFTLLELSVGSCDTVQVCSAGGAIAWLGHLGFVGLLAVSFEAQEKERPKPVLGLVGLCGLLAIVGAGVAGGFYPSLDLANSYAVFSLAFLVWSQYSTEGLGTALVTVSAAFMLSVSGILVWGAHVAHMTQASRAVTGCALSVVAMWLGSLLFHANPQEWLVAIRAVKDSPPKTATVIAFTVNFLGLIFWWVRLDTAASPALSLAVEALLSSLFALDTIVLRQEVVLKHTWLALFYAAHIVVMVVPLISVDGGDGVGNEGLGQVGSAFVWLSHVVFLGVLCVSTVKPSEDAPQQPPVQPIYPSVPSQESVYQPAPSYQSNQASSSYQSPVRESVDHQSPVREAPAHYDAILL